jgi:two-component sensor histidine kinase
MTGSIAIGEFDWVLILAPYRQDGLYMETLLAERGMPVGRCASDDELAGWLERSPGVIVATHEALTPGVISDISRYLESQPNWSELPIIVLLDRAAAQHRIRAELSVAWSRSRHLFYQRPMATLELVSGIQAALLARLRQRDVRDHIERETALRLELNHRVKNILASVSSMFQMTLRGAQSVDQLAVDFSARLTALSKVHSVVFQSGGEAVSLQTIVDITVSPYRDDGGDRIVAEGPDVTLLRDAGTTLALCIHELATNAIKYGALSRPEGRVELVWRIIAEADEAFLILEWSEIGGPPVSPPSHSGYGTKYMRSALGSLFGAPPNIAYRPTGLRCIIRGPLSRLSPSSHGGDEGVPT